MERSPRTRRYVGQAYLVPVKPFLSPSPDTAIPTTALRRDARSFARLRAFLVSHTRGAKRAVDRSVRHERCGGGEGRVEKDGGGGGEGKRPGKRRQERNPGTRERERVYTRARGGRTQRTRTDAAVARKKSGLGLGGGGREAGGVSGTKPRGNRRGREERAGVRERKGGRRGGTRRAVERAQEKEAREDRSSTYVHRRKEKEGEGAGAREKGADTEGHGQIELEPRKVVARAHKLSQRFSQRVSPAVLSLSLYTLLVLRLPSTPPTPRVLCSTTRPVSWPRRPAS